MTLVIRGLKKEDIPEALKIAMETGASCNKNEAKKIMEFSLTPGIKPLNPNYYVLVLNGEIVGVSGLYYDYEDPKDIMWMDYFAVKPDFSAESFRKPFSGRENTFFDLPRPRKHALSS